MRCNHCGRELPEGSSFCNFCGTDISGAKPAGKSEFDDITLDLSRKDTSDLFGSSQEKNNYVDDTGAADYDFGTFSDEISIDEPGPDDPADALNPNAVYGDNSGGQKRKSLLWLWITLAVVAVAAIAVVVVIAINSGSKENVTATPDQLVASADQTEPATADQKATPDEIAETTAAEPTEEPEEEVETETNTSADDDLYFE